MGRSYIASVFTVRNSASVSSRAVSSRVSRVWRVASTASITIDSFPLRRMVSLQCGEKITSHFGNRFVLHVHQFVHAPHFLVGDAAGKLHQYFSQFGEMLLRVIANRQRAFVRREIMEIVFENCEFFMSQH